VPQKESEEEEEEEGWTTGQARGLCPATLRHVLHAPSLAPAVQANMNPVALECSAKLSCPAPSECPAKHLAC